MSFPYTLPTTGAISFADYFDAGEYSNELSEATALRGRLRGALKEAKREDEDTRDFIRIMKVRGTRCGPGGCFLSSSTGVTVNRLNLMGEPMTFSQTIEDYLPYLVGIIACIEADTLRPKKEIGKCYC